MRDVFELHTKLSDLGKSKNCKYIRLFNVRMYFTHVGDIDNRLRLECHTKPSTAIACSIKSFNDFCNQTSCMIREASNKFYHKVVIIL